MNVELLTWAMGAALTIIIGIVTFILGELKDQRMKTDRIDREYTSKEQLDAVERRIMESVGQRLTGMESKIDLLITSLLARNNKDKE